MSALVDLIPVAYRKYLYAVLAAALALYGTWRAVEGDWTQFGVSIITALVNVLASANALPPVAVSSVELTPAPVTDAPTVRVTLSDGSEGHYLVGE